jgi:hypothetical protein
VGLRDIMPIGASRMNRKSIIKAAALAALAGAGYASAVVPNIKAAPCAIIKSVLETVKAVAPALVTVMFVYGGARYAAAADNPGGRSQGKNICISAIVAGVLFLLADTIYNLLAAASAANGFTWGLCP